MTDGLTSEELLATTWVKTYKAKSLLSMFKKIKT
jgi:hypothetical protein